MAKDKSIAADPATMPEGTDKVTGTEEMGGNPVIVTPAMEVTPTPAMETVRTGIDIRNGKAVMKPIPPKKAASVNWNTGDRAPYVAHTDGTGSLNGRAFNFRAGDTINLNADEAKLFAAHVTKVQK